MSKKSEKALRLIEYVCKCDKCYLKKDCNLYGGTKSPSKKSCCGEVLKDGFEIGWDIALKNQWVSIRESLPCPEKSVLVLTLSGRVTMAKRYFPMDCNGNSLGYECWSGSKTFANSIIAWMPIPSFDEILKDNRDVLKRLKDK